MSRKPRKTAENHSPSGSKTMGVTDAKLENTTMSNTVRWQNLETDGIRLTGKDDGLQIYLKGHNKHVFYADKVVVWDFSENGQSGTYDLSFWRDSTLVGSVRINSDSISLSRLKAFISHFADIEVQ